MGCFGIWLSYFPWGHPLITNPLLLHISRCPLWIMDRPLWLFRILFCFALIPVNSFLTILMTICFSRFRYFITGFLISDRFRDPVFLHAIDDDHHELCGTNCRQWFLLDRSSMHEPGRNSHCSTTLWHKLSTRTRSDICPAL